MNHLKTILGLLLFSLILSGLLLGLEMANVSEGVTLYKMNIFLSNFLIIFSPFVFLLYLFKQVRNNFTDQLGNWILLGVSVILIILTSFAIQESADPMWDSIEAYGGNYTTYPPLGAIPSRIPIEGPEMFAFRWMLRGIWLTLVFLCLFIGFRLYRNGDNGSGLAE